MTETERRARLEKALERGGGTHTLADVVALIREDKAQWWDWRDGMVVTEVHDYPRRKAVHYWLVGGALRDCLALEHEINPWAIERGCSVATASGRRGWSRVLPASGWHVGDLNYWKPLVREGHPDGP